MPPIVLEVDDEWGVIVGDLLNVKSDYARKRFINYLFGEFQKVTKITAAL